MHLYCSYFWYFTWEFQILYLLYCIYIISSSHSSPAPTTSQIRCFLLITHTHSHTKHHCILSTTGTQVKSLLIQTTLVHDFRIKWLECKTNINNTNSRNYMFMSIAAPYKSSNLLHFSVFSKFFITILFFCISHLELCSPL